LVGCAGEILTSLPDTQFFKEVPMGTHIWLSLVSFWHHWYGKVTAFIGVGGITLGSITASLKWLAEIREKWHAGSVAREQLEQLRKQDRDKKQNEEDEDRIPQVMERFDVLISEERKAKNLWAGFMIPDVEWFIGRMPGYEERLVRKAYKEWKGVRTVHHPIQSKGR
jgi:hypothetical protein